MNIYQRYFIVNKIKIKNIKEGAEFIRCDIKNYKSSCLRIINVFITLMQVKTLTF